MIVDLVHRAGGALVKHRFALLEDESIVGPRLHRTAVIPGAWASLGQCVTAA